jgi:excisionase family DNA binding protein
LLIFIPLVNNQQNERIMSHTYQITSINGEELEAIVQRSITQALQGWIPPQPTSSTLPEYCTRKEAAELFRVSLPTLDSYIKRGLIEASRIGGHIRIKRSEIEKAMTEIKSLRYQRQ